MISDYINTIVIVMMIGGALFFVVEEAQAQLESRECSETHTGCEIHKCEAEAKQVIWHKNNAELNYQNCLLEASS